MDENNDFLYANEDAISDNLKCPVCISPFIDPIEHILCGNAFCSKCLVNLQKCPKCREALTGKSSPVTIKPFLGLLNELKVVCPSCEEHFERVAVTLHRKECWSN
jgi:hypothetical protein